MNSVDSKTNAENVPLTPEQAVRRGKLVVNLPVLALIFLGCSAAYFVKSVVLGAVGIFGGIALAWLWWSISVPIWRDWTKRNGADEERTQILAVRVGLVWPKGSIFEKTEFRRRK